MMGSATPRSGLHRKRSVGTLDRNPLLVFPPASLPLSSPSRALGRIACVTPVPERKT